MRVRFVYQRNEDCYEVWLNSRRAGSIKLIKRWWQWTIAVWRNDDEVDVTSGIEARATDAKMAVLSHLGIIKTDGE